MNLEKIDKILLQQTLKKKERNEKNESVVDRENKILTEQFGIDFKNWENNLLKIENNVKKLKIQVNSYKNKRNNEKIDKEEEKKDLKNEKKNFIVEKLENKKENKEIHEFNENKIDFIKLHKTQEKLKNKAFLNHEIDYYKVLLKVFI